MTAERDNAAKGHVLHVDDEPDIRLLIAASLRDFGYVVATAGTSAEALELAKQFKFDLCILDVRLPDGNGIQSSTFASWTCGFQMATGSNCAKRSINFSRAFPCFIIPPTPATKNKRQPCQSAETLI